MEAMGYDAKKFKAEMCKLGWQFGRKKIKGEWMEVLYRSDWKPLKGSDDNSTMTAPIFTEDR